MVLRSGIEGHLDRTGGAVAGNGEGFFGGFEAACVTALQMLGATRELAAPFAIILHLTQFVFTVGLGVIFLLREGLDLRQVVARSRSA